MKLAIKSTHDQYRDQFYIQKPVQRLYLHTYNISVNADTVIKVGYKMEMIHNV